ncbi:protocadherin-16 isoform X1 [Cricetulus griseus]|uniref:protocadherin-16 isoform X1 n=1 Tax=Cricetulus griseus TaxID=10029 RepID=UPI0015C3DB05|nr:protocadherin-16 isoform X1 [Cricetulus griseus]
MQNVLGVELSCPGMKSFRTLLLLPLLVLLGARVPGTWGQAGSLDLQIDEEQPAGTLIGDISAGLPPGTAPPPMYFISAQEGSGVVTDLSIDEHSGVVRTARVLDRERRDRYRFTAVTPDGATVEVTVRVADINDHAPAFPQARAALQIPEHTALGTRYPLEPARDADAGRLGTQGYALSGDGAGETFRLETRPGPNGAPVPELVVVGDLDRENRSHYMLQLEAYDGGSPPRRAQALLDVTLLDINDHAPAFNQSRYHAVVSESLAPGSPVLQVFASDADAGANGAVTYEINRRQSEGDGPFSIDSHTGLLRLERPLDFEQRRVHELVVQARDGGAHPELGSAFVTVHVRDANDNQPSMTVIFLSADGSPRVSEAAPPGQLVARISVSDPDDGDFAHVNVSLEGGEGHFALSTQDSVIYLVCVARRLDREERDVYNLRVTATDSGSPPLRAEAAFVLHVTDVNDNAPAFDRQLYRPEPLPEVALPGSFVVRVTAQDPDQGTNGQVTYSLAPGTHTHWFSIDPTSGIITTAATLDYELEPQPQLIVLATDGGLPPLVSSATVSVALQDVNDNEPQFQRTFYNASLPEGTQPGTCFLQVTATDADSGSFGLLSYSLGAGIGASGSPPFRIDAHSGDVCTTRTLDRDQGPSSFDFTVTAIDGGGLKSIVYVKVFVADENDNPPQFYPREYAASLSAQSTPGTAVLRVHAHDPDQGPHGQLSYHILAGNSPPLFALDAHSGLLTVAWPLARRANSVVQLEIGAQDGGGLQAEPIARVNISIVPGTPTPPIFEQLQYVFSVPEDVAPGTSVGIVQAHNPPGRLGPVALTLSGGDPQGLFSLESPSGLLKTIRPLDRELLGPVLELEIRAGSGIPPAFAVARVRVLLDDVNDNSPAFPAPEDTVLLPQNTSPGTPIYTLRALDPDSGANSQVTFSLLAGGDGMFTVDPITGHIRLMGPLGPPGGPAYELEVEARDGGSPPRTSHFRLRVVIQDLGIHGLAPRFDSPTYRVDLPSSTTTGTQILQVQAQAPDGSPVTYHLAADGASNPFGLEPQSGWLWVRAALDRESQELYTLKVMAVSGSRAELGQQTGTATVRVSILNQNDHSPRLSEEPTFLAVAENQPPGTSVGRVFATDRDSGPNGRLTYSLRQLSEDSKAFRIHPQTGEVTTLQSLDREHQSSFQLLVHVQDSGSPPRSTTGTVHIAVLDLNDNSPTFLQASGAAGGGLPIQVPDRVPPGTLVTTLQAKDPDEGENGTILYTLTGPGSELFSLHPHTGELHTAASLIRAERPHYVLTLSAHDQGSPPRSASLQLLVQILLIQFSRSEDQPPGPAALHVVARDPDLGEAARVSYRLAAGGGTATSGYTLPLVRIGLWMGGVEGALSVVRPLDREQRAEHVLTVVALDHGSPPRSSTQLLTVSVVDINDEAPAFPHQEYSVLLRENSPPGTSLLTLKATDPDLGANGQVTYGGVSGESFSLDPNTGVLTTLRALDREEQEEINLTVYARDRGSPPLLTHAIVRVTVEDENDHTPTFGNTHLSLEVPEGQDPQTLTILRASDPDKGLNGQLQYRILDGDPSGAFTLDLTSGEFGTMRPLDREVEPAFKLQIEARDGGQPALSATLLVTVTVLDANDHAPAFPVPAYSVEVPEDAPSGTLLLQLQAHDPDDGDNGRVMYYLGAGTAGAFLLEPTSGELRTATALDREHCASYAFSVNAVDGAAAGPLSTTVPITITVRDVNDHAPTFPTSPLRLRLPRSVPSLSRPTLALATLRAEDRDAGANASILYRLAGTPPPGTTVDSYTGEIRVARSPVALGPRDRVLFIVATDLGRPARSATGVVIVGIQGESERGPRFPRTSNEAVLRENAPPGTPVISPKAVHSGGSNGPITYSILSGNEKGIFSIQPSTGAITVRSAEGLDFETSPRLRLVLQAESGGAFAFSVLTLTLQDANDNAPRFLRPHYVAFLPESRPLEGPLLQVEADDLDQGSGGQISYSLAASQPARGLFHVDPATGTITTTAILDREIWAETRLVLMATDRGSPALVGSATLTVMVIDTNDNRPTIPQPWELRVSEDALLGSEIAQVTGNDVDSGPVLWYVLSPSGPQDPFSIGRYGGRVSLTGPLDFEQCDHYHLQLLAHDGPHEGHANLTVLVEDVNDNAPTFSQSLYQVMMLEHTPPGSAILSVSATDRDSGANGHISYHLASPGEGFSVDPNNGTLFTTVGAVALGQEGPGVVDVVLEARDHGAPGRVARATVHVQLQDQNDYAPSFTLPHYRVAVSEDLPPGSTLLTLEATDADGSRTHATVDYSIISGNRGRVFQLEPRLTEAGEGVGSGPQALGCLVLLEPLDFESLTQYNLTVAAADRGQPPRSSAVPVTVTVLDVNDNPPVFTQASYRVTVPEDMPVGAELLHVEASDADPGPHGLVRFTLSSGDPLGLFELDENSGALRLAHPLDCETQARHQLVVQAADPAGTHFALVPVTVEVLDVNDHGPAFPLNLLSTSLAENQPPGTLVTTLHAIDGDAGTFGRLQYSLLEAMPGPEGREAFSLNSSTGELRARVPFDYEHTGSFRLLVGAADAGNLSASVTVSVLVTGEDEYDPVFLAPTFHFQVPEGAQRGHSLGHVQATDEDGGADGLVLYSLATSSPYFGINQTTGALYLRVDSRAPGSGTTTSGGGGRTRREAPRELRLEVVARGPLPGSRSATVPVTVDITHTALGLAPDLNLLLVGAVAASLGVVVVLALAALVLGLVRARNRKAEAAPGPMSQAAPIASSSLQKLGREPPSPPPSEHLYHQTLPSYGGPGAGGPYPRGGSLDPSHSSGRGSAEAAEDDEIRMINEFPRVASVASSLAARGPDSGIQQDADGLSDTSCEPPAPDTWYKGRKAGLLLPGSGATLYREEGPPSTATAFLGGCGLSPAPTGDYGFPADGKPCVAGALTAIVAGEEELRGSYNWDYLLSWCPQFQPLASVFTEIARLKDEARPCPPAPRIDPPPLITAVAHPGAKSVPPKPASTAAARAIFPPASHRSPISHEGSLSSAAMSPSFSPSLSPLAARSPVVSPFGVAQGPSASALSTESGLEPPDDTELRI